MEFKAKMRRKPINRGADTRPKAGLQRGPPTSTPLNPGLHKEVISILWQKLYSGPPRTTGDSGRGTEPPLWVPLRDLGVCETRGPYSKGILLFGGSYSGSQIFVDPNLDSACSGFS